MSLMEGKGISGAIDSLNTARLFSYTIIQRVLTFL